MYHDCRSGRGVVAFFVGCLMPLLEICSNVDKNWCFVSVCRAVQLPCVPWSREMYCTWRGLATLRLSLFETENQSGLLLHINQNKRQVLAFYILMRKKTNPCARTALFRDILRELVADSVKRKTNRPMILLYWDITVSVVIHSVILNCRLVICISHFLT